MTDTPKSDAGQSEEAGEIRAVFNRRVAASVNALSALTVEAIEQIQPMDFAQWKLLAARVKELEAAIRNHRDQRGDDRCWLDDAELYKVLADGAEADFTLPPKCEFLESCGRFWEKRNSPAVSATNTQQL